MDLLYTHIDNVPNDESLCGIYTVDGNVLYAATYRELESIYALYNVIAHSLGTIIYKHERLANFDSYIATQYFPIRVQSGQNINGMHIVSYKTGKSNTNDLKLPDNTQKDTDRYFNSHTRRLF